MRRALRWICSPLAVVALFAIALWMELGKVWFENKHRLQWLGLAVLGGAVAWFGYALQRWQLEAAVDRGVQQILKQLREQPETRK